MAKKNGNKLTRSQLSNAAAELNEILEPDPPIDVKTKKDGLIAGLNEAGALIDPQEDELTESTWGILEKLGAAYRPAQEYTPEDRSDEQAEEIIEDNSEHNHIPDNDDQEPTDDRDMGDAKKDLDKDRNAGEDESLSGQESEQAENQPVEMESEGASTKNRSSKKSDKNKPQKPINKSMSRMEAVVSAFSENSEAIGGDKNQLEEIATKADVIYTNNGGKSNLKESRWATKLTSNVLNLAKSYDLR